MQHTLDQWHIWMGPPKWISIKSVLLSSFFVCLLSFSKATEWYAFSWACIWFITIFLYFCWIWLFFDKFSATLEIYPELLMLFSTLVTQCLACVLEYLLKEKPKNCVHKKNKISWNIICSPKVFFSYSKAFYVQKVKWHFFSCWNYTNPMCHVGQKLWLVAINFFNYD